MQVLNEIVMTEKNLINFVLKDVSAQSAAKIAKSSFYSLLHAKLRALHAISKNSTAVRSTDIAVSALGPWFTAGPHLCGAHVVVLDPSPYQHAGVIASMLEVKGLLDANTLWMMHNLALPGGNAWDLVSKYFKESIIKVDEQTVPGYPAPWVAFRVSTMR